VLSIRQRLTLWYTLVLVVILLSFAAVIFVGGTYRLQVTTDQDLAQAARQLAQALSQNEEPVAVDTSYRLLRLDGKVVRSSGTAIARVPASPAVILAAANGQTRRETLALNPVGPALINRPRAALRSVRVLTVPLGQPPTFILQVARFTDDVQRLDGLLVTTLLLALALGLPLAALGGWWLAGRALAPVRAMTETARDIEGTDLAGRLPVSTPNDELGRLAATFNQLLDRLQAAFGRERRFTADVSHDLRTPLALAKSTIGVALNRPRSADELRQVLIDVDHQVDQLAGLLDATLLLTRADADRLEHDYQPVNLSELLSDLCDTSSAYASEEYNQTLSGDIVPGLIVRGDRDLLTRVFLNLLDNAMQYTPRGGVIRVAAHAELPVREGRRGAPADERGQAIVDINDNGVDIAPEDLPRIFDRFYRADTARTGAGHSHHGLGLSIAQAITQAHGGQITATSTLGRGSCFSVRLPL